MSKERIDPEIRNERTTKDLHTKIEQASATDPTASLRLSRDDAVGKEAIAKQILAQTEE